MKSIFTLILSFIFLSISAQNIKPTTLEEYNYMSKGYKIQLASGLDMKKGYEIGLPVKIVDKVKNTCFIEFIPLNKLLDANKYLVGYICTVHIDYSVGADADYTFCFPIGNEELSEKLFSELAQKPVNMPNLFRAFYLMSDPGNLKIKF